MWLRFTTLTSYKLPTEDMPLPFFTVGHSTRTIEEFIDVLRSADIGQVVDVRRLPGSNRYPQFNEDALGTSLEAAGIGFERIAQLGGRRPVSKEVPFETNALWQNRSFHNYADYALSEDFGAGFMRLQELGRRRRTAVMCAEAVWWRCHRRIIADYLIAPGEQVHHVMDVGKQQIAELMPGAVINEYLVTYPA